MELQWFFNNLLDELRYCRGDVFDTQWLLNVAKHEFDHHSNLKKLRPDKAYSPATVGKSCLTHMNLIKPMEKFQETATPYVLGASMQAYYGGRAECHIRRTAVPILKLDFLSQYPSINTLLGNWPVLIAKSLSFPDSTEDVRRFLSGITPEDCYKKDTWPRFRFFALVVPDRDIFPVRAAYDPKQPGKLNIGVNYFTSDKPVWYAGPDIVNSRRVARTAGWSAADRIYEQSALRPAHSRFF